MLDKEGRLAHRVFIYGVDNGTVFAGDSTAIVAGCSQGGLDGPDPDLNRELLRAKSRRLAGWTQGDASKSCLRHFG